MAAVAAPPVRYARSGDAAIAYQAAGKGPLDVALVAGPVSAIELLWDQPRAVAFLNRIESFSRLVLHDRRGCGSSDPVDHPPAVEEQAEDLLAVMDALEIERFALVGTSEAARMATYTAATRPDRVSALVLYGLSPAGAAIRTPEILETFRDAMERDWGTVPLLPLFAPSLADDERFAAWWSRYTRMAASPRVAGQFLEATLMTDVSDILSTIQVPT